MNTNDATQSATLAIPQLTRSRDAPGGMGDLADLAALAFEEDRSANELSTEEIQAAWWDDDDDDEGERYVDLGGSD